MIIASSQGGVNIEDVAAENPDAITYEPIDIVKGITDEQVCRVVEKVNYFVFRNVVISLSIITSNEYIHNYLEKGCNDLDRLMYLD